MLLFLLRATAIPFDGEDNHSHFLLVTAAAC
jgi:hypothetical protein